MTSTEIEERPAPLPDKVVTKRLHLRHFQQTEGDIKAIQKIFGNKEINTFLPWFPVKNVAAAQQFFEERMVPVYEEKMGAYYAVCLKEDPSDRPIGYVTVSGTDDSHDLGYGLLPPWQNQGVITEAAAAVIKEMASHHWQYVTATHDIKNPASGRVMEKLGLSYRYSYNEQWQPKNKRVTFRLYQKNFHQQDWTYQGYWNRYPEHFIEGV